MIYILLATHLSMTNPSSKFIACYCILSKEYIHVICRLLSIKYNVFTVQEEPTGICNKRCINIVC